MVLLSCYLTQYWLSYKENKYGVNSWWGHSWVSSPCPAGLLSSKSSKWCSTTKVLPDRGCWLSHVTCHVTYYVTWLCEWDMSCDCQSQDQSVIWLFMSHDPHLWYFGKLVIPRVALGCKVAQKVPRVDGHTLKACPPSSPHVHLSLSYCIQLLHFGLRNCEKSL